MEMESDLTEDLLLQSLSPGPQWGEYQLWEIHFSAVQGNTTAM